jgi:hypothetical protein
MWYRTWKKNVFLNISCTNIDTFVPSLYQCRNPHHRSLLTPVSTSSVRPFQALSDQRNFCHQSWTALCYKRFPTRLGIISVWISFALSPTTAALFGKYTPQARSPFWLLEPATEHAHTRLCHEAGLCCYLVVHIGNLLRPLQLFYFHLWPTHWLSVVDIHSIVKKKTKSAILVNRWCMTVSCSKNSVGVTVRRTCRLRRFSLRDFMKYPVTPIL